MSDFPYIQEPESLRLELNQVRAALKQAQERTQKAEEQGIAEGRIVHKCNLRIEQLEAALITARDAIDSVQPATFGSVGPAHDHPGYWIKDELVSNITKVLESVGDTDI